MTNKGGSEPNLINCLFSGNLATAGGGAVYNDESNPSILQTTFSGNQNAASGGIQNQASSPQIYNSILWADQGGEIVNDISSSPVVSYCIVEGGYSSGVYIIDGNPQFKRSPDPGSDSTWGTSDDDYGDLRLQTGSPAVDAGNNELLPADSSDMDGDGDLIEIIPYDQGKGSRRVEVPVTADSGYGFAPLVDLGAYELQTWILKVFLPLLRK
jgi:predicted outer membrane repeat protein